MVKAITVTIAEEGTIEIIKSSEDITEEVKVKEIKSEKDILRLANFLINYNLAPERGNVVDAAMRIIKQLEDNVIPRKKTESDAVLEINKLANFLHNNDVKTETGVVDAAIKMLEEYMYQVKEKLISNATGQPLDVEEIDKLTDFLRANNVKLETGAVDAAIKILKDVICP